MKKLLLLFCCFSVTLYSHSAVYKTVDVTAGGLSTTLSVAEITAITDLTVTGSIDARDIKFMRDKIANLAVLNLSASRIVAYSGSGGTNTLTTTYKANEMPISSFNLSESLGNNTKLASVSLPEGVTSIGFGAFKECSGLTNIVIAESVTTINDYAFSGCFGLTSISIPASVKTLGNATFLNCSGLKSVTFNGSISTIDNWTFGGCSALTTINLPQSLTTIGDNTFYGCARLSNISLPNSLVSIGESAFYGCSIISNITIPTNVTSIASSTFGECIGLTNISIPSSVTTIGRWAFYNCTKLADISIPMGVTALGNSAFYNCTGLKTISLPVSIASMGERAFFNCKSLTNVSIPENVSSISTGLFSYCSSLSSITIPNNVKSIENWAFYQCSGLTNVTIGNALESMGISVFSDCSNLTSFSTYDPTPIALVSSVFGNVDKTTCSLIVPQTTKSIYTATSSWNEFEKIVEMSTDHFKVNYAGSGQNLMSIKIFAATLNGLSMDAGDEIAVFNDAICCGKVTLQKPIISSESNSLVTIFASKADLGLSNGYTVGAKITYKIWDSSKNEEITLVNADYFDSVSGQSVATPTYTENSSAFAKVYGNMTVDIQSKEESAQINCYPNPFKEEISIDISNLVTEELTVDIYNLFGQKIKRLFNGVSMSVVTIKWNGTDEQGKHVIPGTYICKVNEKMTKIIYNGKN